MPISHENKIVFVHIPKTGGSSIEKFFNIYGHDNMGDNKIYDENIMFGKNSQHYDYKSILKNSKKEISSYFSFCFVRNPWDKMVSEYFYLRKSKNFKISFKDFVFSIKNQKTQGKTHFAEQISFICDKDNKILVDFVGRFENFKKDFKHVCRINNLKIKNIPFENKSEHENYTKYYDQETKDIIYKIYKNDIIFLNYEFQYSPKKNILK